MSLQAVRTGKTAVGNESDFNYYGTGGDKITVANGSSTASNVAFNTTGLLLLSTVACVVTHGSNPTAVDDGTSTPIAANVPFRYGIEYGDKIAVLGLGGTGTLRVSPYVAV